MSTTRFTGWYIPEKPNRILLDKTNYERIVYVGCVHGGDKRLTDRLTKIASNPPELLIFTGDLTGSAEMEKLKERFYNFVGNRAKQYLGENPSVTDDELLNFVGLNPPKPHMSLRHGYLHLIRYQLKLQGFPANYINDKLKNLTNLEIASGIRNISSFRYYGDWVATLPYETRQAVLRTLESSAKRLLTPINKIRARGTRVIMIEGNWDNPKTSGVNIIAGKDIKEYFDTKSFFINHGFRFADRIMTLETLTTLHILLPYLSILDLDITSDDITKLKSISENAVKNRKQVIMVGHAIPYSRIHSLHTPSSVINEEQEKMSGNFRRIIAEIAPDEVIYGHQHDLVRDEAGFLVDCNAKYILQVIDKGAHVRLIAKPSDIGKDAKQVVVTYIPLRSIAEMGVPYEGPKDILSGYREPAIVEI